MRRGAIRSKSKSLYRRVYGKKLNRRELKQVKRIVNVSQETKFLDTPILTTAISTTPTISDLSIVPQGQTDNTRGGDRIKWYNQALLRYTFLGAESAIVLANDIYNQVRLIIFQFHPSAVAGTTPVASQILLPGPTTFIDIHSHYSHDGKQDFTILYDKTFTMVNNFKDTAAGYTTYMANHVKYVNLRLNLKRARKQVQYVGAGINGTNKIYEMVISDSGATPFPSFTRQARLYYKDG